MDRLRVGAISRKRTVCQLKVERGSIVRPDGYVNLALCVTLLRDCFFNLSFNLTFNVDDLLADFRDLRDEKRRKFTTQCRRDRNYYSFQVLTALFNEAF